MARPALLTSEKEASIRSGNESVGKAMMHLEDAVTFYTNGGLRGVPQRVLELLTKIKSVRSIVAELSK